MDQEVMYGLVVVMYGSGGDVWFKGVLYSVWVMYGFVVVMYGSGGDVWVCGGNVWIRR